MLRCWILKLGNLKEKENINRSSGLSGYGEQIEHGVWDVGLNMEKRVELEEL